MRRKPSLVASVLALLLLVAAALSGWFVAQQRERQTPQRAAVAQPAAPPASAAESYAQAASAFEKGNLETGRRILTRLAEGQPKERQRALVVLGLHLYAAGKHEGAEEILQMVSDPSGELEDWRLFALSESASAVADDALAAKSLEVLLQQPGGSPLRGRALLDAAERTWKRGDTEKALALIEMARRQQLPSATATAVDVLAWRMGVQLGDRAVEKAAAKRLLVQSPQKASELRVFDIFRDEAGRIDSWEGVLTTDEVYQRAEAWLAADQPVAAVSTLATVRGSERGTRWRLLQAAALTAQGKGSDAYALLREIEPDGKAEEAKLEWQRAAAAADVATARAGRKNLDQGQRERMLQVAQKHLRHVIELDVDAATSVSAVRRLYGMLAEQGRFDESMKMLELLRHLDPEDRTGAGYLWERGWSEYQHANYSSAIGYWTQLEQIYPGDRETHRGHYWKGRALEELGEKRRARDEYRQVVRSADTADFYVRQATARLPEEESPEIEPGSLSPAWPADRNLRRVLVLSNFGLDSLAELELAAVTEDGGSPDHERDVLALKGILTVRDGDARKGVQLLRGAFPDLGGPFQAAVPRPVLEAYYPLRYDETIQENARRVGLPPALVAGIIRQESAFDRKAQSDAGARGLMQLMPATAGEWAQRLGMVHAPEKLYDPAYSIRLGSAYFKYVLDRFDGNVELALAGYNGGPNRILRMWNEAGGDDKAQLDLFLERLDISESQAYVKRILVLSDSYRQLYPEYGKT